MADRSDETSILIGAKNREARQKILADIYTRHRGRLRSMLQIRLDRRLRARVDPSDVLQEAFLEASRRLDEYCRKPPMPVFIWLRYLTARKLVDLHRHHFRAGKRSPAREVSLDRGFGPPSQTWAMAECLLGREISPSKAAVQSEAKANLERALDRMDETDREIVALRHFEGLTGREAATVLGIGLEAANKRYLRAMEKLRGILVQMPGIREELGP